MSKKTVDVSALILEAMADEDSLMPYEHINGVSIDSRMGLDRGKTQVAGYWTAPDTGERYYIAAEVEVTATEFSFCPADDYYNDDFEDEEE